MKERKPIKYLSACSGVEAASQAWEGLGWQPIAFAEIEPFPCAVLASRFPSVPNLGDMTAIHYDQDKKELTNGTIRIICPDGIDLIVGGTPCQSFSVAGKREGLEGASGLAEHFVRLLREIKPRWFVWENVPGVLSSVTYGQQRDFNFLLNEFRKCGPYDCEWRVLDTQYVRVEQFPRAIPQRRRRVFIVGHLATDRANRCEVLLEQEGLRGDNPPCRVKGKGIARNTKEGVDGAGKGVAVGFNAQMGSTMASADIEHMQSLAAHHQVGVALSYDGYNQSASKKVTMPMRAANGSEGDDRTLKVAVPVALRGNRRPNERGKLAESDGKESAYTITSETIDSMVATKEALGIGRDMFNVGNGGQMSNALSELMPSQTAMGGGGAVCVSR